ncbi:SLC13 family permease [Vibrio coralliilyticus]|jgi:sodium-dependent dicarboxylate transporter 2/3/5|uniref:SLC13 family permease n=1 Tax=Vibrio coralliilyticus TaxID=190893 RepID=UPI0006CD53DF|nr:SLC13 family permease [Vibrio coralliilyticus]ANW24589.1 dihydroorotate dehydrogenase [Vibrio coralliilyticus]AXN31738.1 SLC13 family permease [Vibrio coralliilyticus]KPH28116.1 dihydroorotate dehydrogenase [Vibrio coralliilyticus]NRF27924.1 SLC13 family permease [Vibrio coralliilyticus]NRF82032.1 SLC13 family permease [Vibrio coralliilyticus]
MPKIDQTIVIKLLICFGLPVAVLMMPIDAIPIADLTLIQHRLLAIFLLAALLWVLEPVPVFATSILIIALELIMISDKGLHLFRTPPAGHDLGELMKYTDIFSAFSSPIIILFMGGFALAIAASKYELDNNLARVLLRPFGHQPKFIMLGLMLITAVFSMFMSNTATTVMMLALLGPIVASAPKGDIGIKALVLCIPIAANTGGIATPIGTPPNAIALQYLTGENSIDFLSWMMMGLPFVIIQLTIAWFLLQKLFPSSQKTMTLKLDGQFQRNWRAMVVYTTFAATILLWMTTKVHGMNTYVVSIIPLAVFTLTGIMGKAELKQINWDVLWLVAGGIAIGIGLDKTGLAAALAHAIDYEALSPVAVVITMSIVCWLMANFMSNTATANLLMPIAAAIGASMESLSSMGGLQGLLVVVAFSASLGMILPVSTPPNSLAYSTGLIESKDMAKTGVIIGVIGLIIVYIAALLLT